MKKTKRPLTVASKLLYVLITAVVVAGLSYLSYYLIHFTFYDRYTQYLKAYEVEEGTELSLEKKKLPGYKDYKLVTESDVLELYLNKKTSDVAVLDKRTGEITFAVPPQADDDPIANVSNRNYLKSHVILNYFNPTRKEGVYDSFSMSVDREQVDYESIQGGVRVIYRMGDFSNSLGLVPTYISVEKFDEVVSALSQEDAEAFARYYSPNSSISGMRELLKAARNNRNTKRKLTAMFESVGFTEDDCIEQMSLAGDAVVVPVTFTVALEYRLEGDHLDVSVPVSRIEEKGGAAIYRIQLLRSFGAQDSTESGYLVVPNGDGSIIHFNNGKNGAGVGNYSQFVYGIDPLAADYTVLERSNDCSMSLFGICMENATILATIEDGASLTSITAGVSGSVNNYNYIYPSFIVRGSETLEMFGTTGNEANLPIIEPNAYDRMLRVRYSFLDEAHSGYTGIAAYMRQRLIDEGVLTEKQENGDIKLYYDVLTGVEMTKFFLGKQYDGMTSMTTFDQAGQMFDALAELGVTRQSVNLQGWFNGGYYHDVADRIRIPASLGGSRALEALNRKLQENGGSLSVDVALQKVPFTSKRYNYQAESSKYYGSGYVAAFGQVNPANLRQTSSLGYRETKYNLVSPKFLVRYATTFADKIQSYDVDGISLRDLGSTLHSDKKRTGQINREDALDVVLAMLDEVSQTGKRILVNRANDYAWSVAGDITNLPLNDNDYILVDENIPLYEMIVHGCIDYCGGVYNLTDAGNDREQILTMLEYGAAPHFLFTWQETSAMKYSAMNSDYSTAFATWSEMAAKVYAEVNAVLRQVSGEQMISHEVLPNGVRKVGYGNGITIYINYSGEELEADGLSIPALGYVAG